MVVVALLFTVIGSITASVALYCLGWSWGMIALGYLAGGWVGLLIGIAVLFINAHRPCRRGKTTQVSAHG